MRMTTRLATCVLGPALACGLVGAEDAFLFVNSGQALGNNSLLVALGDLDGDGDLDAMFANSGPNTVWTNDGTGNFTNSGQELGNSDSLSVALGDLDGDGDLDAMVANRSGQPNTVWVNYQETTCIPGDLDGDGDFDTDDVRAGMDQFDIREGSQYEGDINNDGVVDGIDLGFVLSRWGVCP